MKSPLNTILLVDDSLIVQRSFSALLRDLPSVDVINALSAEEALANFALIKPDFAVVDIQLPGMSGLELLKRIKLLRPETDVIINTNFPSPVYKTKAISLGASLFMDKSKDFFEILNYIESRIKNANYVRREKI